MNLSSSGSACPQVDLRFVAGRYFLVLALAVIALAVATDALAQFGGGMGGGRSRGGGRGQQQERQQQQQQQQPAREFGINMLEQTIEELRVDLKLQPTQIPPWEAYISKVRLLSGDMARERMQSTASTQLSALKRIDRSVDAARNRLAALEEISDSAKALYALLGPEQQAIADPRLAALVPAPGGVYLAQPPKSAAPPRQEEGRSSP